MTASPFPWFEASYRYAEVKTVLYSPVPAFSGNQTLKDKGFDIKIKLFNETFLMPSLAIGITDIAGTGRFSSEYIVASKLLGDLDLSLGIAFGQLGTDKNIRNPLTEFHDSFNTRLVDKSSEGGEIRSKTWFSGREAALFGGLEYRLKKYGVNLKLEYDTSNPDQGTFGPPVEVNSRINLGAVYSLSDWVDLSLSYERGNQIRFGFLVKGSFGEKNIVPKTDRPFNVIPLNREQRQVVAENEEILYRSLNLSLKQERIYIQGASIKGDTVEVVVSQNRFRSYPRVAGRTARIASALSPEEIRYLNIILMNGDLEIGRVKVDRSEFDNIELGRGSPNEVLAKSFLIPPSSPPAYQETEFQPTINFPEFFWKMSPALKSQIGGPEAFYLGQLWWRVNATMKIRRNLSLYTTLGFDIYNNFNELANSSSSLIPHVRSDIQSYLREGENNIAKLKLEYLWSPYKNVYTRLDFGLLEEMFGGFGGEVYYRPFDSNFSVGLTMHKVKQRGFKQRFSFRDYETTTGHLSFYYDWPSKVTSQLLIGKYLAGDKGATLDLSRGFKTGFRVGVFATKTDLSEEEFGEGSFDKGFYFSIPTDLFSPNYRTDQISFGLHPLTKDGGAILFYHNALYGLLGDTNKKAYLRDWRDLVD